MEWAKGQGKLSPLQAVHERLKVESDMRSKQDGAIIAGLLRQQLMKMAPNARDTIKREAMAEQEAKVADEMAGLQLDGAGKAAKDEKDDAGNTNKRKLNAGNTNEEKDNDGNNPDSEM